MNNESPLSLRKRLIVYNRALVILSLENKDDIHHSGLCAILQRALYDQHIGHLGLTNLAIYLPEYIKEKPFLYGLKASAPYWFELNQKGTNKRIRILNKIINKLEKKIKNV